MSRTSSRRRGWAGALFDGRAGRGRGGGRAARRGAFTLIELLVVIAIIAVLVALLVPSLAQAKKIGRLTICQANQRNVATAWLTYVETHQGRFPGYALSSVEHWSVTFTQLLNREFYHTNDNRYYPTSAYGDEPTIGPLLKWWTFWDTGTPLAYDNRQLGVRWVVCPEYRAWGSYPGASSNVWSRPWICNNWVAGGHYDMILSGADYMVYDNPKSINQAYTYYRLGARKERFRDPSSKYLMWEAEAGNDFNRYQGGDTNGRLKLGYSGSTPSPDASKAPWCSGGSSGEYAFRHMLPVDVRQYQQSARAPALYIDGHVQVLNPNEDICRAKFYSYD